MTVDLIPVAQAAQGAAPTIAELREIGERMFGLRTALDEHLRESPDLLAAVDQFSAAHVENRARLRSGAGFAAQHDMRLRELDAPSATVTTITAAVWVATLRHVEARCPHVTWPPRVGSRRMVVTLTTRSVVCGREPCVSAAKRRWCDDGRCELCERPSESFTAHVITLGPCFVSLELCPECSRLFAGEREEQDR